MLDWPWMKLWMFSVTGLEFPANVVACMEALFVNTSYPDARLWNNRVASVVATTRGTSVLGVTAALGVAEAYIYGGQTLTDGGRFIRRVVLEQTAGVPLADTLATEQAARGRVVGWGRPLAPADERLVPTMALLVKHGLPVGPHLASVEKVTAALAARGRPLRPTYGAVLVAIGADFGLSPEELSHVCAPLLVAGVAAGQREWLAQPDGAFMPVACGQVTYIGAAPRAWVSPGTESPNLLDGQPS